MEDCIVSAIRVESKFSDEDESPGKEILRLTGQSVNPEDSAVTHVTESKLPKDAAEAESDVEDDDDKTWNDSEKEEQTPAGGLVSSLMDFQRNLLEKIDKEMSSNPSDEEDVQSDQREEKPQSLWGSSSEDSDAQLPNLSERTAEPKTGLPSDDLPQLPALVSNTSADLKTDQRRGSSARSTDRPGADGADDSEWGSSRNNVSSAAKQPAASPDSRVGTAGQSRERSSSDEEGLDNDPDDPSPVVSGPPEDDEAVIEDGDPEIEEKSHPGGEKEDSWDDDEEQSLSNTRTEPAEEPEKPGAEGTEEDREWVSSAGLRRDGSVGGVKAQREDAGGEHHRWQYDSGHVSIKEETPSPDAGSDLLTKRTAFLPPERSADDLDRDVFLSHPSNHSHGSESEEALPQTDIDDVDLDSPGETSEAQQVRNMEGSGVQREEEDEDEGGDEDEEDEDVSEEEPGGGGGAAEAEQLREKKRDFLSELGLEKAEEEEDSWDSESHSENSGAPHEEDQRSSAPHQQRSSPAEEHLFYIPSFLRGMEGCRSVGKTRGSQEEAGDSSPGRRAEEAVDEEDPKRKGNGKAWQPLDVLQKLEAEIDQKEDVMEELALGEFDDFEDSSGWDSTSTASKPAPPTRGTSSAKPTDPGAPSPDPEDPGAPSPHLEDPGASGPDPEDPGAPSPHLEDPGASGPDPEDPRAPSPDPQDPVPSAERTPQRSSEKRLHDSPSKSGLQPQPRARKRLLLKPEEGSSGGSETTSGNKPNEECRENQQQGETEALPTKTELQESDSSCDGKPWEKPESASPDRSNEAEERHPPNSTSLVPLQTQVRVQQAADAALRRGLVGGARPSRAPPTSGRVNRNPLSVFDDSSLSEESDEERRLQRAEPQQSQNPEDMEVAEDLDELTQSSDTATEDIDSSGYHHASLLVQKLDSASLDPTSIAKLQNIFHEYERTIQKVKSRHGYLSDKVNQLDAERVELKSSLEEVKDAKSALERNQLELQTEVTNLKFQLKQEQENRRNADSMYHSTRDKLRRTEEQQQLDLQDKQKVELMLRNLELEMRTLISNTKRLEEEHSETQRLLSQERSARTLQENLLNSHLRRQQEMEEENKRSVSRSNEALSQLTEASDRERELLQQISTLQAQLAVLRTDLDRSQSSGSLRESQLQEENEALKEKLEDVQRDLKLSNEAVTQTIFSCNNQLTALQSELAKTASRLEGERQLHESLEAELESTRSRLTGALAEVDLRLTAHSEAEKALLREREEHQRLRDKIRGEAASQREAVGGLTQKLAKAEAHENSLENELHRLTLQLTEKSLLLDVLQREKEQAAVRVKELEAALQAERESGSRAAARQEAAQERLAQAHSDAMLLRQQLEEAQNKGSAKERAVTDAQERFSDILSKLRSDCEERVQLLEERNKELAKKAADLCEKMYKLEEEKNDRETNLRQLQQELADSLKKLSMSEASLEVNTRYRSDLEEEKTRLLRDLDRLRAKLEESEDQFVQAERRVHALKSSLSEKEQELAMTGQKLQEALSSSAASALTSKQLEEEVQKLEIENAKLEAAAKQQSRKMEALQKEAEEAVKLTDCSPGGGVRGHLEGLVTNLQTSKMTLEEQLNKEVQKQSVMSHTAQDSQALWEEELKSRSKLGVRLAELEKEKGELSAQMEVEKKKVKKVSEQKKAVDTRLDQEMKRNAELQKEMYRLKTLLKTAKKKLRDQDAGAAELLSPSSSVRMEHSRHAADGRMQDRVEDLQVQLHREAARCNQLERVNGELQNQLDSLSSLSHQNQQLEKSKHQLEEEVLDLRRRMEATQAEYSQVAKERIRQEVQHKLEEVNLFLQTHAASQEALDQMKAANEASLRSQFERRIRELEAELGRARSTEQDSLTQRDSTRFELERFKQLHSEEQRLRKSLSAKLERANSRLAEANSRLLDERSRSLISSGGLLGATRGPPLDLSSLASPAISHGPLNLGVSLLNPAPEGQRSGVDDYLAKMLRELDRSISKELRKANVEVDACTHMDPLTRATQEYLEVMKKNRSL
ncbi:ankyrin repeat domain-containing protein 26 isoform X3 [Oryzias melastigma]|uniref:ankyrin repeat domain-containing protein 26 isoform X3 n=1 Tax=Oryzias melastigma TaxID=30732 RepID=UPI000CF7CF58|nr:ankyrin repeat domain-containing protein 26 isoform X3 [Oryzias melastigma]